MQYLTVQEYSEKSGISSRRVQQMCKDGSIHGAIKEGKTWLIPNEKKVLPLPVGISDYISTTLNYYYVDKTLMIKEFLDERPMVSLFTRPRRFGKSLNMDMLRVFFEISSEDTSIYFKDKKIWKYGDEYTKHQGKYPVIFLSFKDVKCLSWMDTKEKLKKIISLEFLRHRELLNSDNLNKTEKEIFGRLASGQGDDTEYEMSLQYLSLFLYNHYGKECVIIIDEYDTPIIQGYTQGFYNETINFMRNLFSGGLKDNRYLSFGFLTGILRVSKESIFSGMNNLKVYSILDSKYSQYFGFTEEEIKEMLLYYDRVDKFEEVKSWYDGYLFGNTEVYNPWSVINYISDNSIPQAYWQSTGGNEIIGEILYGASDEVSDLLERLLLGEKITTYIDTNVIYPEIKHDPYIIFSFLLVSGYLKTEKIYPQFDGNCLCDVKIPNREISYVYEKEILNRTGRNGTSISIKEAIFSNDEKKLQALLESFMLESVSSYDGVNEGFYHGMMLGLCAMLNSFYFIKSNRESGLGRFDILLFPRDLSNPGFIFEFKYTKDDKESLELLAGKALVQICDNKYDTELKERGVGSITKIGIAFRGKEAVVKRECEKVKKSD